LGEVTAFFLKSQILESTLSNTYSLLSNSILNQREGAFRGYRVDKTRVEKGVSHTDRGDSTHLLAFCPRTRNRFRKPRGHYALRVLAKLSAFSKLDAGK
jgi:hypothetical protein